MHGAGVHHRGPAFGVPQLQADIRRAEQKVDRPGIVAVGRPVQRRLARVILRVDVCPSRDELAMYVTRCVLTLQ